MTPTTIIDGLNTRELLGYLDAICRMRNVTREEICGRGRTKAIAAARHELWWHLRHHPAFRFSYEELGRLFDRNHSTVLQGVRSHQRLIRGAFPPPLQPTVPGPWMPLARTSAREILMEAITGGLHGAEEHEHAEPTVQVHHAMTGTGD